MDFHDLITNSNILAIMLLANLLSIVILAVISLLIFAIGTMLGALVRWIIDKTT